MSNNDYGYIIGSGQTTAPDSISNNYGQVFLATHNEEGSKLSSIERSFISFSWGDRDIEDFQFLVVNEGDRYQKNAYGEFDDSVSDFEILDGQYFWRSRFTSNSLTFNLATDGVEEATLQDFKNWFRPGKIRKLILAEMPNRYIFARVSNPPEFTLLPFDKDKEIKIGALTYQTKTTLWRGEATINFVMDDPFWRSIDSLSSGTDLTDEDLQAIIEDGIPHSTMFAADNTFLLANKMAYSEGIKENYSFSLQPTESDVFLYNCGTSEAKPIITFSFIPEFAPSGPPYIINPFNKIAQSKGITLLEEYNYLAIDEDKFQFTTSEFLTSYNQLIQILFENYEVGDSMVDLKKTIKASVNNIYIRMWALSICDLALDDNWRLKMDLCDGTSKLKSGFNVKFKDFLFNIFYYKNSALSPFTCIINSKTGSAQIEYKINHLNMEAKNNTGAESFNNLVTTNDPILIKENTGDMIRSDYLKIDKRTLPNSNNIITSSECLPVTTNCTLTNVSIDYEYTYL